MNYVLIWFFISYSGHTTLTSGSVEFNYASTCEAAKEGVIAQMKEANSIHWRGSAACYKK